jgi:RNA polymerase sigma-70 factor, ECF subfamily
MSDGDADRQMGIRLVARVATGDEAAFTELYRRFSSPLFGMALRILNDPKEAEDVLQESFSYMWGRAGHYDPERSSAFGWAVMIVRHKAIDKLRLRQRFERIAERAAAEAEADPPEVAEEESLSRERQRHLRAALERIPQVQREAVELAFFRGYTHEEIARRLETPLGTVKARIRRGLLRLRDCIKEGA